MKGQSKPSREREQNHQRNKRDQSTHHMADKQQSANTTITGRINHSCINSKKEIDRIKEHNQIKRTKHVPRRRFNLKKNHFLNVNLKCVNFNEK